MSAQHFFRFPWAISGDKTAIPQADPGDGSQSWEQGFTLAYQQDPGTDPGALLIPRAEFNAMVYALSDNARQYQLAGFPEWVTSTQNGGTPVSYSVNSYVRWNGGSGTDWAVYLSLIDGATAEPGTDALQWGVLAPASTVALLKANNLSDLTNVPAARTALGLGSAALQPASTFLTAAAPVATGGLTLAGRFVNAVAAVAALDIDWGPTATDFPTKSIAVNSTFTFSNLPGAGVAQVKILTLTLTAGAIPTFPASVVWLEGATPSWSNGVWDVGLKCIGDGVVHGKAAKFAS